MSERSVTDVLAERETWRFAVVGVAGTLLYFGLGRMLVAGGVKPAYASACAFACTAGTNYVLHRYWAYRSAVAHRRAVPAYFATAMAGLCLSTAVVSVGTGRLKLPYSWMQAVAIVLVILLNWAVGRLIFRTAEHPSNRSAP